MTINLLLFGLLFTSIFAQNDTSFIDPTAIKSIYDLNGVKEIDMMKITRNMLATVSNFTQILEDGVVNHLPHVVGGWKLQASEITVELISLNDVSVSDLLSAANPKLLLESDCNNYPCPLVINSDILCEVDTANYIFSRYDKEKLAQKLWELFEIYFQNPDMELTIDTFAVEDAVPINPEDEGFDIVYVIFIAIIVVLIFVIFAIVFCYQQRLKDQKNRERVASVAVGGFDVPRDNGWLPEYTIDEAGNKKDARGYFVCFNANGKRVDIKGKPVTVDQNGILMQEKAIKKEKRSGTGAGHVSG